MGWALFPKQLPPPHPDVVKSTEKDTVNER